MLSICPHHDKSVLLETFDMSLDDVTRDMVDITNHYKFTKLPIDDAWNYFVHAVEHVGRFPSRKTNHEIKT